MTRKTVDFGAAMAKGLAAHKAREDDAAVFADQLQKELGKKRTWDFMRAGITAAAEHALSLERGPSVHHLREAFARGQRYVPLPATNGLPLTDKNTRAGFNEMPVALAILNALSGSAFAVQFTTYPPPRIRARDGTEGPCATIDFAEESWVCDTVQLIRDLCAEVPYALSNPNEYPLAGIRLTSSMGRQLLERMLAFPQHYPALEAIWRMSGRDGLATVIMEQVAFLRSTGAQP